MKRILLPTDFSDNSWNAIKYALQLFKDETCNFTLLNTYTPIIYQLEAAQLYMAQHGLENAMKEVSKKGLEKIQERIDTEFKNPNHTFSRISAFNTLTDEINELHSGHVMDMIIMGTKGASGIQEVLFGSNTIHIIKKAKCPVLAIPSDFDFEAPHEILFPSDYQVAFQESHIKPILDITNRFYSRVNILHVSKGNELTEEQEQNKHRLLNYLKKTEHLFHIVTHKNIPEAIADFQLKSKINLLVMLNNKHSFFENLFFKSNIKHIGFHLNIPFLVIPSKL
ncbi:universal stress protein [uncultured Psychroserpens sp.]|uniref:universal stress protein n=1 Tax=uncultured Psychroserpens sp. TaxID=255436 RepID=UPI0026306612|nr:universal stress protein [uncultured Psychroserpens sp.]